MASKKLATLLQAVPPATARHTPEIAEDAPEVTPQPVQRRPVPALVKDEPEVPLQVLVPDHIREELGIMAAKERTSLRSLILRGVRSLGIEVTEEEIRGKRGRKRAMKS
jgi:hypothetical protein